MTSESQQAAKMAMTTMHDMVGACSDKCDALMSCDLSQFERLHGEEFQAMADEMNRCLQGLTTCMNILSRTG